jgi:hypothetical protein
MRLPSTKTTLLTIAIIVCTVALTTLFASLLNHNYDLGVPSFGTIYALGFEVHGGNITVADGYPTLDWGTVYVGSPVNRSLYIRSKSNVDVRMNLTIADWAFNNAEGQPASSQPDSNPITVTLDYNGTFTPDQEIRLTLTLNIHSDSEFIDCLVNNHIRAFTFRIMIQPSQV